MLKSINIIFTFLSRLFITAGIIIGFLGVKKMGVLRSVMYRNQNLLKTVLSPLMLKVYGLLIVTILIWLIFKMIYKERYIIKEIYILLILVTAHLIGMILLKNSNLVGIPLMLIGIIFGISELSIKLLFIKE